ncbi:MAG: threonine--tRNA ligase [Candidatus Terrybacteria bacterium CG10_big_fil_rev_8_21_14_0_10_41_10]|uniref:Threonine--tRNA ligase n=1 Tax=Candidatus Terrybacteria bacterium CG10_big_fil_rev_8_21_14_0_10_41_10 TaxID=1975026 RepID=A0A2M8LAK1_9BACT|nr:MAG: threonine--tRNA ligase [Candidatus Terrybacteria bacterium CG10_big_fil_rev_8_21_14_0_10_41_10]
MKSKNNELVENIRHSLAHIMAAAITSKHPEVKLGIGPTIENGFYYDFDFSAEEHLPSEDKLPKLENFMHELIKQNIKFEREEITAAEARKIFANQPYKLELINKLEQAGEKISIYKSGNFTDLCAGPHVASTKEIDPESFKLTKIAGAYWRGDEKNKMLTRIYGIAFETKKELDDHLTKLEEAEKRDHRKLGKELDLFSFHQEGPGFPFWHPKGTVLYNELKNFIRKENEKRGYGEVMTPIMLKKDLWVTSGHWDKFRDNMYFSKIDEEEIAVKPMNCPGGMLIYKDSMRSYRDLPLRYSEFGLVHRHELSGVLHGLLRVRAFTQDDAHSYCAQEQLNSEIINMVDYAIDIYKTFGFDEYEIFIATKPEKHIGENDVWELATNALTQSLKEKNLEYHIKEGEGAFYGPKIEFNIKDAIGRNWQMGTIQVDLSMPTRFGAEYTDNDGSKKTPVMVHRAILGSLERFIGVLIEHYAGAFPLWLSPTQVKIIPVGEKFNAYGEKILSALKENEIRVEIDSNNESLGKRIRAAKTQKIPYILVVGEKEQESESVAVNARDNKKQETLLFSDFITKIKKEMA